MAFKSIATLDNFSPVGRYIQEKMQCGTTLVPAAWKAIEDANVAYKRDCDVRLRGIVPRIQANKYVFMRKKCYNSEREKYKKLWPVAYGPFQVVSVNSDTFVMEMGTAHERISSDCDIRAPPLCSEVVLDTGKPVSTDSVMPDTSGLHRTPILPDPTQRL